MLLFLFTSAVLLQAQKVDSLFYGNSKLIHKNPYGWGYIAGTNGYGDVGKYQRFDALEEMNVVGAKLWMGVRQIVNTPDSITIVFKKTGYGKDYYDTIAGGPGATIASIKTTLAAFDTTGKGTSFFLAKPFNVYGSLFVPESVFVGIEWSTTADDTFALFADSAKQGENFYRAWEQLTGGGYKYQRFNEPSDFSWLLDGDLWIALLYRQGLLSVKDNQAGIPGRYLLEQNYPNPFNPTTTISFSVPVPGYVSLKVFNMIGDEVAVLVNDRLEAGRYTSTFSARTLASGMYFYQLRSGSAVETKRMVLVK